MDDDIPTIQFKPRKHADHPPLEIEPKRGSDLNVCKHTERWIHREARTVTCKKCGVQLDPFDVLYHLAIKGMNLDSRIAEIREANERDRKVREHRAAIAKGEVPNVIGRAKPGDKIEVSIKHGRMRGLLGSVNQSALCIDYEGGGSETIQVEDITAVRIIRRAR